MKTLFPRAFIFFVILFNSDTALELESIRGTVFVTVANQNYFIIAADSRAISGTQIDDCHCKITTFGNKFMFSLAGAYRFPAIENGRKIHWDSDKFLISDLRKYAIDARGDWVKNVAHAWGDESARLVDLAMKTLPQFFMEVIMRSQPKNNIMDAVFAGIESGKIIAYKVILRFENPSKADFSVNEKVEPIPLSGDTAAYGFSDVIREINDQQSMRAKSLYGKYLLETRGKSVREIDELFVITMVQLTIDHRDWYLPNGDSVGGQVDAVSLDSSGVHWLKTPNCNKPKQNELARREKHS